MAMAVAFALCAVCAEGGFAKAASSASTMGSKSKSNPSKVSYAPSAPSCLAVGSNFSVNMELDPGRRCGSACFTVVSMRVNSSEQCSAWSNFSVWESSTCKIACDRVSNYNRSLPNGTCVVGEGALPIYPGVVNVSDHADLYAVPVACPTPPWVPPCNNPGLSVGENMHMSNRCFSKCFTVALLWLNTSEACEQWSEHCEWVDGVCKIGCEDLPTYNNSLPNGTCVVDGVALPVYPGVVNVSDREDAYAVPMECVSARICKFSQVVTVSNDFLCAYNTPRFIIMIVWVALAVVSLLWTWFMYAAEKKMIPDWLALGMIFLVVIGVVWEVGVVIILFGGIGYVVYVVCFHKKEYQLVNEKNDPAKVPIDSKQA